MELLVKPVNTDLAYHVFFKEPALDDIKEDARIGLIGKISKGFGFHLNDLKFNNELPSNNFIHFSRFYNTSFFDVSYGLEEVRADLKSSTSEEQLLDVYGRLFELFKDKEIVRQRMAIQQQLAAEQNVRSFFESTCPHVTEPFEHVQHGRGLTYFLKIPEHDLVMHVMIATSLYLENGLFFNVDYEFSPNRYDFSDAYNIAKEYYSFIFAGLKLSLQTEA